MFFKRNKIRTIGLSIFLLLLPCLIPTPLFSHTFISNIPDIGQENDWVIDNAGERIMGRMMMQELNKAQVITHDAVVNHYLQQIAKRFQPFVPPQDNKLHFFCVDDPVLNAFAFFGGNIAVHSGLVISTDTESELAAVLAHETAHIVQHHLARIMTNNKKMTPVTIAQILGALALGMLGGAPDAGIHLANAAIGGHIQNLINYTKTHEQEADRIGIKILAGAGFDPHAMPSIFSKMSKKTKYQTKPPEYLLTHPVFEERMADSMNRASKMPRVPVADNLDFHLIRARLAVMSPENARRRVKRMKAQFKPDPTKDNAPNEYALALALAKNRQFEEALQKISDLIERHPNHWLFKYSLAEIAREQGETEKALQILQPLSKQYPDHYPIQFYYAETLLDKKHASEALAALAPFEGIHNQNAYFMQLLARTHSALHNKIELHNTQAEWHALRGEFKEAFQQLDLALSLAQRTPKKASLIKQRKLALEELKKKQEKLK